MDLKKLKVAIITSDMTLKEISQLSGVRITTISNFINKPDRKIHIKTLSKLTNALNIEVEELIN